MKHWEGRFSGSVPFIYSLAHEKPDQRTLKAFNMSVIINYPALFLTYSYHAQHVKHKQLTCKVS